MLMEPKQTTAQSTGMLHGVVASTASYKGHHNRTHTECVARLDNGTRVVLHQSGDATQPRVRSSLFDDPYRRVSSLSRSEPAPLEIGSHVMVSTDPRYCERDTRVPHPVARMWRRAKPEEIPAASGAAFKEKEPLHESSAEPTVPAARKVRLSGDPELDDAIDAELGMWNRTTSSHVARTTPFSETSELARTIERKVGEALRAGGTMLILYDPTAGPDYPFIFLTREFDALRAASLRLCNLGSSRGGWVCSSGRNGCGYIDKMPSGFADCMQIATDMTFIQIDGLARQSEEKAEIEASALNFCLHSAQFGI